MRTKRAATKLAAHRHAGRLAAASLLVALGIVPLAATADHDVPNVLPDLFPKIRAVVSPLAGAPAIIEDGSALRIELDPAIVGSVAESQLSAALFPSFGAARAETDLPTIAVDPHVTSGLWPGRSVHAVTVRIPALSGSFVEDLYDVRVSWGSGSDVQHRAVKVVDAYPAQPRFAIISDPSVGDPRAIQEGAEELIATGSADSLLDKTLKTVGNPMNEDRWAALGKAIDEINLAQPDFVLVSGDLTFAFYPRPVNYEYEDAYRILSRLRVPAFLSPGNHDLYDLDYDDLDRPHTTDGKRLWPLYFGPLYYSVDVGPNLHIVSLNTFDWAEGQREPFDENGEFETRAGGQIDDEQYAWLVTDLAAYRQRNAGGAIVTFAHHDPSWIKARHPWPGKNRLETRDLLAERDVGVHFAGHTHEDRVARYHQGNVAETNGRFGPDQQLHYIVRNDTLDPAWTQEQLGAILRDPSHGPVFVTTTTVSSVLKGSDWGLGGYWGWRLGVLREQPGGGYDPADFGYPATREFLDGIAERPEKWNPDHAAYGVFSYPSYHLDVAADGPNDGTRASITVTLASRLLVPIELVVPVSVAGGNAGDLVVAGGTVLRTRTVGDRTDLWIATTLPANGGAVVSVTRH